jgi:hypothetical protein
VKGVSVSRSVEHRRPPRSRKEFGSWANVAWLLGPRE